MAFLDDMSWLDWATLGAVSVALVLGLFRGFLWQASRFLSLVLGFWLASRYAEPFAEMLRAKLSGIGDTSAYYLGFLVILIATILVLSIVTKVLEGLVRKTGLGFYDHVGGALLGGATAACGIIAALGCLYHLMPSSPIVAAARESRTHALSRYVVEHFGLPDEIQRLYAEGRHLGDKDPSLHGVESGTPGASGGAGASGTEGAGRLGNAPLGDSDEGILPLMRAQRERLNELARRR